MRGRGGEVCHGDTTNTMHAFLKEGALLNPRIAHFLDADVTSGVQNVRAYLHSTEAY